VVSPGGDYVIGKARDSIDENSYYLVFNVLEDDTDSLYDLEAYYYEGECLDFLHSAGFGLKICEDNNLYAYGNGEILIYELEE
jgi:hypothetical protein